MHKPVEVQLTELAAQIKAQFGETPIEFTTKVFENHAELWVYVLALESAPTVRAWCHDLALSADLDNQQPEIWIIVRTWSGPWDSGGSEQELRRKRREEFRARHQIATSH